ncbi:MAG: dTDP-4-dehydrorhamnose reductase [Bacteroidetes bacterium ADurb.Bin408]|nr:MAG: dTDP-4-dehydrorhamnose reductase [Bacteroidetes bacterium ADurb.Bin408]
MNILITGAYGQLGSELKELSPLYKNYNFTFTDADTLDLTNFDKVTQYIKKIKPDVLINAAAYTAVDKAESEKDIVYAVNAHAVKNLAELSAKYKFTLVQISTDYVFEGLNYKPYTENDTANPKSIYAKSKYESEIEMIFNTRKGIIIRTSWLYSSYGNNFVKTILKLAKEKGKLEVIFDQIGTPTYAADLAKAILDALPQFVKINGTEIYNFSNEGVASWYDFAKAIVDISGIKCTLLPIETKDYKQEAKRPLFSVLNKNKFKKTFKQEIPYWRDSLAVCLKKMGYSK